MSSSLNNLIALWSFCFGAVIASFLNVVIWRLPRGESIVRPPSHCPKCNEPIRWYQNLPILSYLALRGRCAHCRAPISPRYLIIELAGGLLFWAAYLEFGLLAPLYWVWFALAIVGFMIDFDHKLLPDFVTIGGIFYGLLVALGFSLKFGGYGTILYSVVGAALGLGLFGLIRFLGSRAFKREAMGMGDVLLMGAVGAISGPVAVLFVLMFSSLAGSLGGLAAMAAMRKWGRNFEIPYGPYILVAHLIYIFFGGAMIGWYLGLFK